MFVARSRVGVVPGVKMEAHSSLKKEAILGLAGGSSSAFVEVDLIRKCS